MDTAFTLMVLLCLAIQLSQNYPVSSVYVFAYVKDSLFHRFSRLHWTTQKGNKLYRNCTTQRSHI